MGNFRSIISTRSPSPDRSDETALVAACLHNDPAAFRTIGPVQSAPVSASLRNRSRRQRAEDVVQDSYLLFPSGRLSCRVPFVHLT
jgi:hypothetical protein